jgi:hypothetical protein
MQSYGHVEIEDAQSDVVAHALASRMRDVEAMQRLYRVAERHGRLPRDSLRARALVADVLEGMVRQDPDRDK